MTTLPASWQMRTLGDVARWGSGGTPKAGNSRYYGGPIPWAVIGDLTDGPVSRTSGTLTEDGLRESSAKMVPPGAVLVAMYGSIGKLGLASTEMATNQAIAFAVPHEGVIEARFLFLYLMAQRENLSRAGKGATQQNIGQGTLKAWPIPLPPLEEQHRIVDALEDHLSRLDAADVTLAINLGRINRLRQGVLERRFITQPPIGARERTLIDLIEVGRTMSYGVLVPGPDTVGGVPLVRVGDIRGGQVHAADLKRISPTVSAKFPRSVLRGGELLLSLVGTIGRVGVAPHSLAGANVARAVGVLPLSHEVDARYLAYALQAPSAQRDLEGRAHEVARKTLNLEDLRRVRVPVPGEVVQRLVVAELDERLAGLASMENAVWKAQARSRGLRRSLLKAAFAGRLVRHRPSTLEM